MDSEEQQRRQRIESICNDYLAGEAPVLVCTLMKDQFHTSPWPDKTAPYRIASTPHSQLSNTQTSNTIPSPSVPSTPPPPPPQETATSIHNQSTQEFDSDNERTIPYDVYDMENSEPDDVHLVISSSPPK